jgi:subtilisin-like proprotein convertase family protein
MLSALMLGNAVHAQVSYTFSTPIEPLTIIHNYTGATNAGSPRFNRPLSGIPPTALSSIGTDTPYHAFDFSVTETRNYSFFSGADYDQFLVLYGAPFNPADPLANALAANDDLTLIGLSGFDDIPLTAGVGYTLVTTGFGNDDFGNFENFIYLPGTTVAIPDDDDAGISIPLHIDTLGQITSLDGVTLIGLDHTWIGDLTISLSHNGVEVALLDRLGRTNDNTVGLPYNLSGDYTFAQGGMPLPTDLGSSDVLPSGTYAPAINLSFGSLGFGGLLSDFIGQELSGTWTLNISDRAFLDEGFLLGWSLNVTAVPEPGTYALLVGVGLPLLMLGRRRMRR